MTGEEVNWSTVWLAVVLALIAAAVPVTLSALLGRRNANKKLQLDETTVILSGTDSQIRAYQDLLDRANAAVERAEKINKESNDRISQLEETMREQDWQIATLRKLFQRVVNRSNIALTPEEQEIFDSTKPMTEIHRIRRRIRPT